MNDKLRRFRWSPAIAVILCLTYILFVAALAVRQHDSFHTHAFDMAYFDNVIWNTSQGRLFVNDFPDKPRNFLGEHFSPALILLAPLYWLLPDARVLLVAQAVALGLTVVPSYLMVHQRYPRLALVVMLALYLNPALLGVALSEFHEITLAAPFVAWVLWRVSEQGREGGSIGWLVGLVGGLLVALAFKEEVAVIVAAVGVYLSVEYLANRFARRASERAHNRARLIAGVLLVAIALLWLGFVWGVLPSLLSETFSHWQMRYGDIAPTPWQGAQRLLGDPAFLIGRYASPQKLMAVARVLTPLAFLPLLAPSLLALALPVLAYLLLSEKTSVSQLQFWYVTPLLPILFVTVARVIAHAPPRIAPLMALALLTGSVWGYWQWSAGPLAVNYEPARFAVGVRSACGARLLALIPPEASLSAQDTLMPHLSHRRALFVFPSLGEPLAEYVAMDARYEFVGGYSNWPTLRPLEVSGFVHRFLSNPHYDLIGDGCDYKILRHAGSARATRELRRVFAGQIELLGYDLSTADDEEGIYRESRGNLRALRAGQSLRVVLWWRAAARAQDYTVFVHALDAGGRLVGQHDSPPANGARPMSGWQEGEVVRDIHYFTLEADAAQIAFGLYDARTGKRLTLENGADVVIVKMGGE